MTRMTARCETEEGSLLNDTLPPPPRVIQYFEVPRYIFTKLIRCKTARQGQFWADSIRTRFKREAVRTV
jgi:hypothetical protein